MLCLSVLPRQIVRGRPLLSRKSALTVAVVGGVAMGGAIATLPWESEVQYGMDRDPTPLEHTGPISHELYSRTTVFFDSHGVRCEAWFYEPSALTRERMDLGRPPPIVVMAHGLGSQKDMGLHPYAEQFAASGLAVMVFDYRSFGGSDGWPRHEVNWRKHLEDWEAAVEWVAAGGLGTDRVDPRRLALWGVSYSGGHVLSTAAALGPERVAAVVANEPYLQAQTAVAQLVQERGLVTLARAVAAAVRGALGMTPAYIKLIGGPGELSLLQLSAEEMEQVGGEEVRGVRVQRPAPQRQGGWRNLATARMVGWGDGGLLGAAAYNPLSVCPRVACPALVVAGTRDTVCPPELARKAVEVMGSRVGGGAGAGGEDRARLLERPHGHLELHKRGAEPEHIRPEHLGGVVVDSAPAGPLGHQAECQFG
ncbi:hypothetical protein HYH03_009173 [Edaphochlamys debaryana]|uniref:Xaa-Pro dipeptidyl-peptidase-like domain-containing protein n=1 Tax=Edaphochlamys debaryana TaxID=47281 RepID=A0A836BYN7_9CHLO|nr:hypothetical protein HYH03_009173 [Edaphochlamys debaryana]|eukprot:KAG2492508.1 hypothetical protein HYH03_009173 [Edaphochlamys debaryana]